VEECVTPSAVIQAPLELSSCPDSSMTIDGSRSRGSGIKALTLTWGADPILCDNYYAVATKLTTSNQAQVQKVSLGSAELANGNTFVIWLQVSEASQR
jgi:hypothetical protein